MDSFTGRVAVVTGGGSGIGRALVESFAREGARVVVADIDERAATAVADGVRARGGAALAVRTDVSGLKDVEALADRVFTHFGGAHVLCNNAGVALWGGLETMTHRDWQWVLGVNLWGVIHGVEAFVPRMIARGEPGHVVNTASMAGLIASQGLGVYNTSKFAVVGLSETLAKDLRQYRIGVSVLCPLGVATEIRRSDRNRPAELCNERPGTAFGHRGGTDTVPPAPPGDPMDLIGKVLTPEEVAAMTLAAIRANRLHVITHAEAVDPLRRRAERLERAILDLRA